MLHVFVFAVWCILTHQVCFDWYVLFSVSVAVWNYLTHFLSTVETHRFHKMFLRPVSEGYVRPKVQADPKKSAKAKAEPKKTMKDVEKK